MKRTRDGKPDWPENFLREFRRWSKTSATEITPEMWKIIKGLDKPHADAFRMAYREGMTNKEIAELEGVTAWAISNRLRRIARDMYTLMDTEEETVQDDTQAKTCHFSKKWGKRWRCLALDDISCLSGERCAFHKTDQEYIKGVTEAFDRMKQEPPPRKGLRL